MTPAPTDADRLALAKGYPYAVPRRSYLYVDGDAQAMDTAAVDGRLALIAFGSNRSPEQLARKYRGWPEGTTIPVSLARLRDHDVVYSAHFARYGALPAALHPAPGVTAEVHVLWLTEPQLARMHETEGPENYRFAEADAAALETAEGIRPRTVFTDHGRRGAFAPHGVPVPLAAVDAAGRSHTPLPQHTALAAARDLLEPGTSLDDFILSTVADDALRRRRTESLAAHAVPAPTAA